MRYIALILSIGLALPQTVAAQDETLADIRQELNILHVEIQKLKRELSTTGNSGDVMLSGSVLDRVDAMERELQRLTGKTETIEMRIERVVADGTNRIGDLEFRLVELEGGDLSQLGETTTLGGGDTPAVAQAPAPTKTDDGPQLAVAEEADFRRASEALAKGDFRSAADLFTAYSQTYSGGPLAVQAMIGRGRALGGLGQKTDAARAYLEAFSSDPQGADAHEALLMLGKSLGELGQTSEACVTLDQVSERFPNSSSAGQVQSAKAELSCS